MNNQETIHIVGTLEIVDFLKETNNYPDQPESIGTIETHMSWLFLTDHFVYKLKKPVKLDTINCSTVELRYKNCMNELRLNKRLAPDIYLDVMLVSRNDKGELNFNGDGKSVDWIVKMKRLPAEKMLDELIKNKASTLQMIEPAAIILSKFYCNSVQVVFDGFHHRNHLKQQVLDILEKLESPEFQLDQELIKLITVAQLEFLANNTQLFNARVEEGKIIDTHGDLRPEHICLSDPPVIIDCLEFDESKRIRDIVEELAFLALECEMLNAPTEGEFFIEIYAKVSKDNIPNSLIYFYKGKQAMVRAYFVIWHILETPYKHNPKWLRKTNEYIARAKSYADLLESYQNEQ